MRALSTIIVLWIALPSSVAAFAPTICALDDIEGLRSGPPLTPSISAEAQALFDEGLLARRSAPATPGVGATALTRAADLGHPRAQYLLGQMYAVGDGLPLDYPKAQKLLRAAAPYLDVAAARYAWCLAAGIDRFLAARSVPPRR